MSNNNPMCDDTLANKGVADPDRAFHLTDEMVHDLAVWLYFEYEAPFHEHTYDDRGIKEQRCDICDDLTDVGVVYTTCMEYDPVGNRYIGDEHDVQFSYDLVKGKVKLYLDNDLIYYDDLTADLWVAGMDYDTVCGDIFDLCNEYAPLPDEHEYC